MELLEKGAKKVYTGARNLASLDSLKQKYGDRIIPILLDVTDKASISKAAESAGDVEILVNNAGVFAMGGFFSEGTFSALETNLNVNVWGLVNLTNALAKSLRAKPSSAIINVSSVAGLGNMPMAATYSASKAAVHSITQGMRAELAAENVLVIGVYPGPIDTDMTKEVEMDKDSPENVARDIIQAMIDGTEDVFPDVMSKQVGVGYFQDPKAVEKQFAQFL